VKCETVFGVWCLVFCFFPSDVIRFSFFVLFIRSGRKEGEDQSLCYFVNFSTFQLFQLFHFFTFSTFSLFHFFTFSAFQLSIFVFIPWHSEIAKLPKLPKLLKLQIAEILKF